MSDKNSFLQTIKNNFVEYLILTVSTLILVLGVYLFKFPNNFSFGGVTGLAVVLAKVSPISPSTVTLIINMSLLVLGFIFLGKDFGIKTIYVSILTSVALSAMEFIYPISGPLTSEPLLDLLFAVFLPALGSAILFQRGASSGGTDIIAMIMKKYTSINIGTGLFLSDVAIAIAACFVFGMEIGLFSFLGLSLKSLVVDKVIESMNLCKYFNVVCDDPKPICEYITNELHRGATVCRGEGAYSNDTKSVIITALKRKQAVQLRNFVKSIEPNAFMLISSTSEIVGKGFQS